MKKIYISIFIIIFVFAGIFAYFFSSIKVSIFSPSRTSLPIADRTEDLAKTEIVLTELEIPWEIAFLPDGKMLVTERPGRLLIVDKESTVIEIEGVEHVGEGGLLGLAIHPDFEENQYIYLYLTTETDDGLKNRVERYRLIGNSLSNKELIISEIEGANYHDGGRIKFGPDGFLYISTGDATESDDAQDIESLSGKILRITDEGDIPEDNPFGNEVYSFGHRNPQGITWDDEGRLWISEHGPSFIDSGQDEINLIVKGGNYGWPDIIGSETAEGMISPVIQSGEDETWAPAGIAFADGRLFFTGLRGESLYEAKINEDNSLDILVHFDGEFGRLRAVTLGPDGYLYISTSNRDGRGEEQENDDKVIRFNL